MLLCVQQQQASTTECLNATATLVFSVLQQATRGFSCLTRHMLHRVTWRCRCRRLHNLQQGLPRQRLLTLQPQFPPPLRLLRRMEHPLAMALSSGGTPLGKRCSQTLQTRLLTMTPTFGMCVVHSLRCSLNARLHAPHTSLWLAPLCFQGVDSAFDQTDDVFDFDLSGFNKKKHEVPFQKQR